MTTRPRKRPKPVWRMIVKKSEKQGDGLFDVLVCGHAVPVDAEWRSIRYRKARACPTCAEKVAKYAAEVGAKATPLAR